MSHDIFTLVDCVDTPYEQSKKGRGGIFWELQSLIKEVLVHLYLFPVHVDETHTADLEALGDRGLLEEERDRVLLLGRLVK